MGFGVKAGVAATSLTIPKGEKSQSSYRAGFTGGFFGIIVLIPAGRFQQTCFMHVRVLILSLMVMAKTE